MLHSFRQILRRLPLSFVRNHGIERNFTRSKKLQLFAPLGLVVYAAESKQLKPPNPQDLTSTYLIKNASVATVDAASALLTQITCSLLDAYQQYQLALVEVIKLLELNLTVIGEESKENMLWDVLLQIRSDVSYWRNEKEDLEGAYCCAERSLAAAAEAAHIAGATYAGMAASERLFSAKARLREAREKAEESESVLRKLDVETIQKTVEHKKNVQAAKKEASEEENVVIEEDAEITEKDVKEEESPA